MTLSLLQLCRGVKLEGRHTDANISPEQLIQLLILFISYQGFAGRSNLSGLEEAVMDLEVG